MAQWISPFDNYLVVGPAPEAPGRATGVPGLQRMALILLAIAVIVSGLIAIKPAPALSGSGALEAAPAVPVTETATETVEVAPAPPEGTGVQRIARMSHYWPPLGGVNCAQFVGGKCVSRMASGLPWEEWIGRAAACPVELPFGTVIELPGGETFYCLDRGGKVVTTAAGELWIDLLVERAPVPYGAVMPVTVRLP